MIVPANASATTVSNTLNPTDTSGNYSQTNTGFFSIPNIAAGYAGASVIVNETTYTNNFSLASGTSNSISFYIDGGSYGKVATVKIIALANSATSKACSVRLDSTVIAASLPGYSSATTTEMVLTGVADGSHQLYAYSYSMVVFKVEVVYTDAVTVSAGSQVSTDGSSFRLIGTVPERTSTSYNDITDAGFEITYNATIVTVHCTKLYDNLTAVTGGLNSTTYDGSLYVFAYTIGNVPANTSVTVRAFVVLAGTTVYSSSGTVNNVE